MFKACKLIPNPTTVQTDEGGGRTYWYTSRFLKACLVLTINVIEILFRFRIDIFISHDKAVEG